MKLTAMLLIAGLTAPAFAEVTFTSVSRTTSANVIYGPTATETFNGAGAWNSELYSDLWEHGSHSWGLIDFTSTVGADSIVAHADGEAVDGTPQRSTGRAYAYSGISAAFTVTEPTAYDLDFSYVWDFWGADISVRLCAGPTPRYAFWRDFEHDPQVTGTLNGVLAPGDYTFDFGYLLQTGPSLPPACSIYGSYDLALTFGPGPDTRPSSFSGEALAGPMPSPGPLALLGLAAIRRRRGT